MSTSRGKSARERIVQCVLRSVGSGITRGREQGA